MARSKSGPTLVALNAQIAALQAQAETLRRKEVVGVIAKAKDAIAHYGLTAADLGFGTTARQIGKSPAAAGGKPARKRRKSVAAKPPALGLRVKLQPAGHILGSAYVEFDVRGAAGPSERVQGSQD